jgi:hypothetical protein
MAREPVRRADPPEQQKPEPPAAAAKAAETPTKTTEEARAERPKVSLHLGKASAPSVYATPYGSEPVNIDAKTGRAIAPSTKPAEEKDGDDRRQRA